MAEPIGSLWTHWHGHTEVLLGLAIFQAAYLLAVGPVRERYNLAESADPRQTATFTLGVFVIFFSILSPLHVLADEYLFSAHMLQHVLLTLVASPLLIIGTPDWVLRPLMRPDAVFRAARVATHPIVAFALFNIVFAMWHMPGLYNLSVTNHAIHIGEHLLFMATATLMWWPIASNMPELPRLSYPLRMVYLFLLSIAQLIVFGPVTFSSEPLYQWYVNAPEIWGVSPLVDQQLGAIVMKVGGAMIFITLMIAAFFRWFSVEEEKTKVEAAERGV